MAAAPSVSSSHGPDSDTRSVRLAIADIFYTVTVHLPTLQASYEASYLGESLSSPIEGADYRPEDAVGLASGTGILALAGEPCTLSFDHSPRTSPAPDVAPADTDARGTIALSAVPVTDGRSATRSVRVAYDVHVRGERYEDNVELFTF